MAHAGSTEGQVAALSFESVVNHRKLVAKISPRAVSGEFNHAPADRGEMLHCAASQGILFSVLAMLADGRFSCDKPDRFGRTPLHWAAEQGHRNVVLALLRAGACVDARSQRNFTPIMLAASGGHETVVGELFNFRVSQSECWPLNRHRRENRHWKSNALHCAAACGHMRLVEALVDAGFNRGQHDGAGLTPAEVCTRLSHSTSVAISHLLLRSDRRGELLLDCPDLMTQDEAMEPDRVTGDCFIDWQDGTGHTPLHRAVHFHHALISRLLLRKGADPNIPDRNGASPLHTASCNGSEEIAADLLEAGADMELLTVGNYSPLRAAVAQNRANVVDILLNAGASTEHRDAAHGQTALSWACRDCLAPIVRALVEAGADVESRSFSWLTPLHWACRFNDAESVEVLLNAGADPCAVDEAARDAVAASSSSSDTIASMPTAIDVIGLACPLDRMDGLETSAVRPFDLVTVGRIESALKGAKKEHAWRRRGWLVMIAAAAPCQEGQTRDDIGARDTAVVFREDLVSALLGLAAVEAGLFRRVVMFV